MPEVTPEDITRHRLRTQRVTGEAFARPVDVVTSLLAVQSQDVPGAVWSVGQRVDGGTEAATIRALNDGAILRTHLLRPTWHFVTPDDIRWLLDLTGPRVQALNATYYRKADLDATTLARTRSLLATWLADGKHRTRPELGTMLAEAGIGDDTWRLSYIMMDAELEGIVCSGAMRGKQQTYALLDERAPAARRLDRDEALAEMTRRFFAGHGPATVEDAVRWCGLTVADLKRGIEAASQHLEPTVVGEHTLWSAEPTTPVAAPTEPGAHLLPEYDEAVLTFKRLGTPDLPWVVDPDTVNDAFYRPLVLDGPRLGRAGTWRRRIERREIVVDIHLFAALDPAERTALDREVARYGAFHGLPARWETFAG